MGITKSFIYLLVLGLVFLVGSIFLFNSIFVFVFYNMLSISLLILDYFISPKQIPVEIEFCGVEKLSLGERELISFKLYNKNSYDLYVELKDELPDYHFGAESELMSGIIRAGERREFKYFLIPSKRGNFRFENLYIKFTGRLNLCTKRFKKKLEREIKVYPNLKNIRRYRLMILNNRSNKQGRRNIRDKGRGTSFESLREYLRGDDYKKMNWKATARMNEPIINQYQPEKNQKVYMLIDSGRSMSYKVRGYRKLDLVLNSAVILSDIINQKGDRSGLFLFNTKVNNIVMPGRGAGHRNKIMEALYKVEASKDTPNYREAFYRFKEKESSRSIVFLFTDFASREEAKNILKVLPYISKNNRVVIILIKNEKIERITQDKPVNSRDIFNKGVALELLNQRERDIKLLNRKGVFCIECRAEELNLLVINKYIEIKNKDY